MTNQGIKADPNKIQGIVQMKSPNDVTGIKRFCGMVQYLSRYLASLSDDLEPLRQLTKKGVPFIWSEECENAFSLIKKKISSTPVLAFYNPDAELTLQTIVQKMDLGSCLCKTVGL